MATVTDGHSAAKFFVVDFSSFSVLTVLVGLRTCCINLKRFSLGYPAPTWINFQKTRPKTLKIVVVLVVVAAAEEVVIDPVSLQLQ